MRDETEAIDPDVDLRVVSQRRELLRTHGAVLAVVALARFGLSAMFPAGPGRFPWATFVTNVSGCFLIGVLMVLITEAWTAHRLARPFLGVGVLGGFTTFSAYAVESRELLRPGTAVLAVGYLAGTLICAMLAVLAAVWLTRTVTGVAHRIEERA
ncbi:CrcB family protein [Amycolatopsis rubida]|uniref:Fluoride-specific ion channel FluC n=1 Tax=Amycolatopsis rubida TaxID=112413 RepID=A0ABX0BZR3_9PSEU|nr:CrcB family protein [Amycolatopsis sp. M39]MYW93755.1 chromosome condensation protein CrcB [Amycolatopsis rubida]NEC58742.1 CrcB family protein [Amycolatopsis rubida]OAP22937.1 putative fluoride ion transporter CrcB [Amycolatopsis sp. M39]